MATPERKGVAKRFELRHDRPWTVAKGTGDDDDHGYVSGFAIVSKIKGEDYYDQQDEHVPLDVAEAAAIAFMKSGGDGKIMHGGEVVGRVVESFIVTKARFAALGLPEPEIEGWVISWAPASAEVKKRFDAVGGDLAAFSIGGEGWVVEEEIAA